jgi:hypothetical protein
MAGLPGHVLRLRPREILWGGTVPPRRRGGPAASFQLSSALPTTSWARMITEILIYARVALLFLITPVHPSSSFGRGGASQPISPCSRQCLRTLADRYLESLVAHDPSRLPFAPSVTLSGRHRDETLTHRRVAHSFLRSLRPNGGVPADEWHSTARKQAMRISISMLSIGYPPLRS